jgi:hypothetical protein
MIVQWLNIALNSLGRISIESLERVFPLKVRGVVSRRFEVGNTAGEYTVCGSSPHGEGEEKKRGSSRLSAQARMAQKLAAARSGDSESAGAKAAGGSSGAVVEVGSRAQRQPAELQVSVAGALESSRAQRQPA